MYEFACSPCATGGGRARGFPASARRGVPAACGCWSPGVRTRFSLGQKRKELSVLVVVLRDRVVRQIWEEGRSDWRDDFVGVHWSLSAHVYMWPCVYACRYVGCDDQVQSDGCTSWHCRSMKMAVCDVDVAIGYVPAYIYIYICIYIYIYIYISKDLDR